MGQKFDEALLKAVDFAFDTLGESCRKALYFHLRTTFHVRKREIPKKVGEFDKALRLIFKDGAVFLERLILERLVEGLGVEFNEKRSLDFVGTVLRIRDMVWERESLLMVSNVDAVVVTKGGRGGEEV